jgi:cell wall-active antibiotic response 4TMS protein YvqF
MARPFRPEVLVLGLSLIAVGVAWLLGNAGRIDLLGTLRTWWPLTLVLWGALELVAVAFEHRARRS